MPGMGISFLSTRLRTTGYVEEIYTEDSVTYVGSSLANHDQVSLDIEAILASLAVPHDSVVLQGHSFGTNIVKRFARSHGEVRRLVFLSPADSVALYRQWRATAGPSAEPEDHRDAIRWDLFGMTVEGVSYPLPISAEAFERLLESEVFREWSADTPPAHQPSLIIVGAEDPVSNLGTTANSELLLEMLPASALVRIQGARHLFTGFEEELCHIVADWIRST